MAHANASCGGRKRKAGFAAMRDCALRLRQAGPFAGRSEIQKRIRKNQRIHFDSTPIRNTFLETFSGVLAKGFGGSSNIAFHNRPFREALG
jgi:hypothetical protein